MLVSWNCRPTSLGSSIWIILKLNIQVDIQAAINFQTKTNQTTKWNLICTIWQNIQRWIRDSLKNWEICMTKNILWKDILCILECFPDTFKTYWKERRLDIIYPREFRFPMLSPDERRVLTLRYRAIGDSTNSSSNFSPGKIDCELN